MPSTTNRLRRGATALLTLAAVVAMPAAAAAFPSGPVRGLAAYPSGPIRPTALATAALERGVAPAAHKNVVPAASRTRVHFGAAADARALVRAIVGVWRAAFPDLRFEIEDQIVRGDAVVHLVTCSGTHTGTLEHPAIRVLAPSGRSFAVDQMHITRVRGGRIVQHWGTRNDLAMLQQLGAVAAPHTPGSVTSPGGWQRSTGT
ncbi:MAG: ester cyclase [Solirubrobacterales bacterium]|nr:ester cyclase [Solirubrobacterales bacterium]